MSEQYGLLVPDFSEVKDTVMPGIYHARIVGSEMKMWAGKDGKPNTGYVKWTLETFNEQEPKNNGRKIFHNTPYNGAGAFRLKEFYKAAMHEEITGPFDRNQLHGKELELTYGPQANKPEYSEVKSVKALA